MTTKTLEEQIDERVGEVRTDTFDISFGEIVNLHQNKELIIQPEYQRLFRWSTNQKSQLIESILLELPVPQIFVIENQDGVFELIDGLQRVSSVIQFLELGLFLQKGYDTNDVSATCIGFVVRYLLEYFLRIFEKVDVLISFPSLRRSKFFL